MSTNQKPEIIRHTRALDELLWQIYVYLVDPQLVIQVHEPEDKPTGDQHGRDVHH